MHHRHDVGTSFINLTVNETLRVAGGRCVGHRFTVQVIFCNVGGSHQCRSPGARQEIMIGIGGIANAHMAVTIQHTFIRQNMVGQHQLIDDVL